MNTGYQNSLQPTACSAIFDKIVHQKKSLEKRNPDENSYKTNAQSKNRPNKNKEKNEIILVTKKLKRLTCSLPKTSELNGSYQPKDKKCETCSTGKNQYRTDLESAKVVNILVDDVIEKEQIDRLDEEYESDDMSEDNKPQKHKSNEKGDKISLNFSVYCEGDVIKHNLKCVLIRLQKTIGDIMVQICFVKSRKLGNEERYKVFDVPIFDLKILKYEYTNLTDAILPLLKKSSGKNNSNKEVCVACIKEKLCDCNERLVAILQSGRNLRVVMRNDEPNFGKDQCCNRDYPHVHAEVGGKPIVLKYSKSFQIKTPSKTDKRSSDAVEDIDAYENELTVSNTGKNGKKSDTVLDYNDHEHTYDSQPTQMQTSHNSFEELKNTAYDNHPQSEKLADAQKTQSLTSLPSNTHRTPKSLSKTSTTSKSYTKPSSKTSISSNSHSEFSVDASEQLSLTSKKSEKSKASEESSTVSLFPEKSQTNNDLEKSSNNSLLSEESTTLENKAPQTVVAPIFLETSFTSTTSEKLSSLSSSISTHSRTLSKNKTDNNSDTLSIKPSQTKLLGHEPGTKPRFSPSTSVRSIDSSLKVNKSEKQTKPKNEKHRSWSSGGDSQSGREVRTLSSSTLESSLSSFNQLNKKNENKKDVISKIPKNTTAFPIIVKQSTASMLSNKKSKAQLSPNLPKSETQINFEFTSDAQKTPFKEPPPTELPVFTEKTDPLTVSKEELLSHGSELKNPYKIKDVKNHNKTIGKLLKQIGKEKLLTLCSPPKCCKANNFLVEQENVTNLPLSASIDSLFLDQSDLEYFAKVTGTRISYEDLTLVPEEGISTKEYEWEIQYADDDQDQTKWLKALKGTCETKNTCVSELSHFVGYDSTIKRESVKNVTNKDEPRLSTIAEEELCSMENEDDSIPFMPIIPSLPIESKKLEPAKNNTHLIGKHTTMELRYFTVEFTEENSKNKNKHIYKNNTKKINNCSSYKDIMSTMNDVVISGCSFTKSEGENQSCSSFYFSLQSAGDLNGNYNRTKDQPNNFIKTIPPQNRLNEIIMMRVINLCNESFDLMKYNFTVSSNQNLSFSQNNILCCNNTESSTCSCHFSCKTLTKRGDNSIGHGHLVNDVHVNSFHWRCNCMGSSKINKSYEIIKSTQNNHLTKQILCYPVPATTSTNSLTTNLKKIALLKDIKKSYKSVKLNQLQAVIKNLHHKRYKENNKNYFAFMQRKNKTNSFSIYTDKDVQNSSCYLEVNKNNFKETNDSGKTFSLFKHKKDCKNHKNFDFKDFTKLNVNSHIKLLWLKLKPRIFNLRNRSNKNVVKPKDRNSSLQCYVGCKINPVIFAQSYPKFRKSKSKITLPKVDFSKTVGLDEKTTSQAYRKDPLTLSKTQSQLKNKNSDSQKPLISTQLKISDHSKLALATQIKENKMFFYTLTSQSTSIPEQTLVSFKTSKCFLTDQSYNAFYFFDICRRRPLTDNLGRLLKNLKGSYFLIKLNKQGNQIFDSNNKPVCDVLAGCTLNVYEDNSTKVLTTEVLKSFISDFGHPLLLFDLKRNPLTSVCRAMLMEASGEGLIQFICTGNLLRYSQDRPVLDSTENLFLFFISFSRCKK